MIPGSSGETDIKHKSLSERKVWEQAEDDLELEIACNLLERAIQRIPSERGEKERNTKQGIIERRSHGEPTPGRWFGRSIEEIFNHSWRACGGSEWIWIPKPALLGERGFPARSEEIRREGWKARRLFRVHPPPPITKDFVSVVKGGEMLRDNRRPYWGPEMGGGEKRRFEEERGGNRFQQDRSRGGWMEEDRRRESQRWGQSERGRGGFQASGSRNYREEEETHKKRAMDNRREGGSQEPNRERFNSQQGNPQIPVRDRLGTGRIQSGLGEESGRGRGIQQDSRGGNQAGICYWCRQDGHHQADCTNPPFCFRCKESGHISAKCPTAKGVTMHMYGFGFPGQGFHSLKIPGLSKQPTVEHQGLIWVEKGGMTENRMEAELKHLIDEKWQWKVKQVAEKEFLTVFPNKQLLDAFSKSAGFKMALNNIWATVCPSTRDPAASSTLQKGWVKIFNVPDKARNVEAVTLIAELAGEVIAVDELSIIKDEAVRVKIRARDIDSIRGYVEFFVEETGYEVKFVPETTRGQANLDPPGPPKQDEDGYGGDDDEDLLDSDDNSQRRGSRKGGSDKASGSSQKGNSAAGKQVPNRPVTQASKLSRQGEEVELKSQELVPQPLAAYDPVKGLMLDVTEFQKAKELEVYKSSNVQSGEKGEVSSSPSHNFLPSQPVEEVAKPKSQAFWTEVQMNEEVEMGDRPGEMEVRQWVLPASQESLGLREVVEGGDKNLQRPGDGKSIEVLLLKTNATEEADEETTGEERDLWKQTSSSRKKSIKRRFCPAVAARKSARTGGKGFSKRGTTTIPDNSGMFQASVNSFTILNTCDREDLENLATSCDIKLGENSKETLEIIEAMKLEEVARAEIAEANYRDKANKRLQESHALEGENLELQKIDNEQRLIQNVGSGGNEQGETASQGEKMKEKHKKQQKAEKGTKLSRELKRISLQ
ncbi:unnamed protein product [Urochloa humidicola]